MLSIPIRIELRIAVALALAFRVGADSQLIQISLHSPVADDTVVQSRTGCHTPIKGDNCYKRVVWAMQTGVAKHPQWFSPLNKNSSFEDFQRHLHNVAEFSDVCPEPCAARSPKQPVATQLPSPEICSTPVVGDDCYKRVVWVMQTGVVKYPELFSPLTNSSSFEDFQRHLHNVAEFSHVCPEPCAARAPQEPVAKLLPASESCRTPVEGDDCYKRIAWAMQTGVAKYPQWFSPLNKDSSFEDFQRHLHNVAEFSDVCPEPCAARAPQEPVAKFLPASESCRTPVEGDDCYKRVAWAMQTGVAKYPQWFFPLNKDSSFEDFQRHLHNVAEFSNVCPEPCAARAPQEPVATQLPASDNCHTSAEGEHCHKVVVWAMRTGIVENPMPYTRWNLTESSSFEDFQRREHDINFHVCPKPCPARESAQRLPAGGSVEPREGGAVTHDSGSYTPEPTLPPGIPCTCLSKCSLFWVWDLDENGCLEESECDGVEQFVGVFQDMDQNGDGCVTKDECEAYGPDFDPYPIPTPVCPAGSYAAEGTSVCQTCEEETRRRRASTCTDCPEGRNHVEHCDRCIGDIYLNTSADENSTMVCVNTDRQVEEHHGIHPTYVLTRGDTITIAPCECSSFGQWHKSVIEDTYLHSDGTACFELRDELPTGFDPFSPVTPACSATNGTEHFPCGCGCDICEYGEVCDESANSGMGYCYSTGKTSTPAPTVSARGDPHLVNLAGEHFDVNHGGEFTLLRIPQDSQKPAEFALKGSILPEHGKPCTTYITEVEFSGAALSGRVVQVRSFLRSHAENESDKFLGLRVLGPGAPSEAPWETLAQWTDKPRVLSDDSSTGFRVILSATQWHSKKRRAGGPAPSAAGQVEVRVESTWTPGSHAVFVARQDLPRQEHLNVAVRQLSQLGRADVGGLLGFDPHPASLEDVTPECQRHRDGLDQASGPRSQRGWRARWEKIKARRGEGRSPGSPGGLDDGDATASLIGGRSMMCVCSHEDAATGVAEDMPAEGLIDDEAMDGVAVEFQTGRLAEATWD